MTSHDKPQLARKCYIIDSDNDNDSDSAGSLEILSPVQKKTVIVVDGPSVEAEPPPQRDDRRWNAMRKAGGVDGGGGGMSAEGTSSTKTVSEMVVGGAGGVSLIFRLVLLSPNQMGYFL